MKRQKLLPLLLLCFIIPFQALEIQNEESIINPKILSDKVDSKESSPLSVLSKTLNKEIFQYDLGIRYTHKEALILEIEFDKKDICSFNYIIDFEIKQSSPFHQIKDFTSIMCSYHCSINIPYFYDKLTAKMEYDEELYLYYYVDKCINYPENNKAHIKEKKLESFNQINKANDFFNIEPNKGGEKNININEQIIFNGTSKFVLSYSRPDKKNQTCIIIKNTN